MKKLVKEIHKNAKEHGWWDEERTFGELIALCHSELSEALEEYRNHKGFKRIYTNYSCYQKECPYNVSDFDECREFHKLNGCKYVKPEGIPIELADVIIRILDMCGKYGIDIEEAIRIKHEYNKTRPYKHGGKII